MEIGEIRVVALLLVDSSNLRFKSESDVIVIRSLYLIISMISLKVSFFPVHKFRGVNVKIGISTAQPVPGKSINTWRVTVKEKWANKLIVISIITFETMEKFIRFRARRCWCIIFVCYMPFNIDPWFLFSSLGSRRRNLNKMPHLCNLPTGWTKLATRGKHF